MTYANQYETYEIKKIIEGNKVTWRIEQDGIFSDNICKTQKEAKKVIDNQEVRW